MAFLKRVKKTDDAIIYKGVYAHGIDIRVEIGIDYNNAITIYADNELVGSVDRHDIAEEQQIRNITLETQILEILQNANVGR